MLFRSPTAADIDDGQCAWLGASLVTAKHQSQEAGTRNMLHPAGRAAGRGAGWPPRQPEPDPAGGTRLRRPKSISGADTKFLILQPLGQIVLN